MLGLLQLVLERLHNFKLSPDRRLLLSQTYYCGTHVQLKGDNMGSKVLETPKNT